LIADCFFGIWCRILDCLSHFFQNILDVSGECSDILIYCFKSSSQRSSLLGYDL
jgi:hypothetical protein